MNIFCYTPPGLAIDLISQSLSSAECREVLGQLSEVPEVSLLIYLKYFFLTCLLESPFYWMAVRSGTRRFLSAVVLCNLATHPIVCFGIPFLMSLVHGNYGQGLAVGEVFAPVVEALLLIGVWKVPQARAWTLSILANLFSWWVGIYAAQLSFF